MVNQDIQNWLKSDQEYHTGVALYNQYGTSETLKRMFSWGKTSYNQSKLVEVLEAVVMIEVVSPSGVEPGIFGESPVREGIVQLKIQQEIEKLDAQWKPIFKKASMMHAEFHMIDADKRKEYAFAILDSFDQMHPIWKKKEALLKGEQLPDPEPIVQDEPDTPVQMLRRIQNLTVQISKQRKNPKRAEEVKAWEKEREDLKLKLQQDGNS